MSLDNQLVTYIQGEEESYNTSKQSLAQFQGHLRRHHVATITACKISRILSIRIKNKIK